MKKLFTMVMVLAMLFAFSVPAFAQGTGLTLDQAKQAALDYAGVKASEAVFTKAYQDRDDGRLVYEIEFYADGVEYDMDVDVNTGRITDFSREYHGGYGTQSTAAFGAYRDYDDFDDRYDYDDYDDLFDYDDDFDDLFDFDD